MIERAGRILEGKFDLLGYGGLDFGEPVDWHVEPVSGKRAPHAHWSRIEYLNSDVAGDKKITWELNRHQHFMTLGRAYWHTGDERYAERFVAHLSQWMEQNPPKLGINWASSLEVSFRAISWLWAFHFFKDSPRLTPQVFLRALRFLYLHARHLETYLSTYFSPNTHLTGEALGLFYLGTLLSEMRGADRWRTTGGRILLAQLEKHVRPDGVYFEQTSYYHRYTTDFYTHFLILARANGEHSGEEFDLGKVEKVLAALLDHLMHLTRPDGTTPLFGDDDGGRLAMLDERAADDFRATLATGAALLNRADYKFVAGEAAEETLWLLGADGLGKFDRLAAQEPAESSRAFAAGGYYSMRDGWTRDANYLLIDCGPHGALKSCGHAHADALSFDLAAYGRTLLVDPGTYTYTGSASARDYFRGTAAHNTLTVDGESSSEPGGGAFTWKHVARSTPRRWISGRGFDYFEGQHDGYERLAAPATHSRGVLFLKGNYWIVRDRVETGGAHRCDLHFHFAPDAAPVVEKGNDRATPAGGVRLREEPGVDIFTFGAGGEWRDEEGWVSPRYGRRLPARVSVFSASVEGTQDFFTFLIPHRVPVSSARRVREIKAAAGGFAFEVEGESAHDTVLVRGLSSERRDADEGIIAAGRFRCEGDWAWARSARDNSSPREWVLIGGRQFLFDGEEIFGAAQNVGYAAGRHVGRELVVETDARGDFRLAAGGALRVVVNGKHFPVEDAAAMCFHVGRDRMVSLRGTRGSVVAEELV
ncbi:MAG: alginate lyase family protein [Pyrinomonadaceae bacterium]